MSKLKLAVIFGGISSEHSVSIVSGTSIIEHLDKDKYEIYPIYITKDGQWYKYIKEINKIKTLNLLEKIEELEKIDNIICYLKKMDVIFPVLHGLGGEDGTIQGLLELINVPYIGCGVLASSIGMDKVYTKMVLDKANIKQAKYEYIRKYKDEYIYIDKELNESIYTLEEICEKIMNNLKWPIFVKPSNSGSSVGISKVKNKDELKEAIEYASKFDKKLLIEQGIKGRELECAILGNEEAIASCVGEIIAEDEFYSFDAKYKNKTSKIHIPADIEEEIQDEIKKLAIKAFKAIDAKGLSRVDFFLEDITNNIYINEINTLPGFTNISMYPMLFKECKIGYKELLNKLIELALEIK